jgi:hypothetical protein
MGKTLTSILIITAAIAVNVIPGIGQVLSAAIGSTLATAAISAITVMGIQSALGLLGIMGGGVKPDTTETAIKTSRPPRVSAYGRSRLYGAWTMFETSSTGTSVDVFAVHDGQLDAVEQHYLADDLVTVAGGVVAAGADGRYEDAAVHFYTTDGSVPGAGFPAIESLLPGIFTSDHRGDGVVAMALTGKAVKAKNFQSAPTRPRSTRSTRGLGPGPKTRCASCCITSCAAKARGRRSRAVTSITKRNWPPCARPGGRAKSSRHWPIGLPRRPTATTRAP